MKQSKNTYRELGTHKGAWLETGFDVRIMTQVRSTFTERLKQQVEVIIEKGRDTWDNAMFQLELRAGFDVTTKSFLIKENQNFNMSTPLYSIRIISYKHHFKFYFPWANATFNLISW